MTAQRDRTLTDPAEVAACRAFAAAWRQSGLSQQAVADALGVTPGMVSHWANARSAIPAIRAAKLASLVGVEPERISVEYATLQQHFAKSQPQRLDPQMMAESLVAVLKAQERDRRAFKPGHTARALCAIYELRAGMAPVMSKKDLAAFDLSVESGLNSAWEALGERGSEEGAVSYRSNGDPQPAVAADRRAARRGGG